MARLHLVAHATNARSSIKYCDDQGEIAQWIDAHQPMLILYHHAHNTAAQDFSP
ncbi:MAG: hypothetical protein ACRDHW_24270 [Ktedonobacteraceae bacterium]